MFVRRMCLPHHPWVCAAARQLSSSTSPGAPPAHARRSGVVREWHPFERRGTITEDTTGTIFTIPNSRAFETMLPTSMRDLVGAKVTFVTPPASPSHAPSGSGGEYQNVGTDRVVIRRRSDDVHAQTYRRPPPKVDLLAAFRVPVPNATSQHVDATPPTQPITSPPVEALPEDDRLPWQRKKTLSAEARGQNDATQRGGTPLALDILVDLTTLPQASPERQKEDADRAYLQDGIAPATHLKDLRATTLLNAKHLTRLRQLSGFKAVADKDSQEPTSDASTAPDEAKPVNSATSVEPADDDARPAGAPASSPKPVPMPPTETTVSAISPKASTVTVQRYSEVRVGTIVAWSPIHRTGLVLLGALDSDAQVPVVSSTQQDGTFVIRNVEAFQSAMPSSLNLVRRQVRFTAVKYSDAPHQVFAEDIIIDGPLDYSMQVSPEVQEDSKDAVRAASKREKYKALIFDSESKNTSSCTSAAFDDPDLWYRENLPAGAVYGVLTRWSGGQGTIEVGSGRTYFVDSAAQFLQLVDATSSQIRGAVVTFGVDADMPRYARRVNILTLSSRTATQAPAKPLPLREPPVATSGETQDGEGVGGSPEPQGVEWLQGFLVWWSKEEGQGIIHGADGHRYLLRDAPENVHDYKHRAVHLLGKGRNVKFVRMGDTGRVACHVVALEEEADAETLRKATLDAERREPTRNMDGNMDEAVASPLSTGYWMTKLEKVGFDVSEVKKRQTNLMPPDLVDDDDDPMLDTKELFSKDRWFNDKDRNIKIPGSDVRAGDIAQMSPTAMVNLAGKISSPTKLEKMKDKYFNQLSEEMKAHAWAQAKEMAPRYGKRMREAREKGDDPSFHFY